MSWMRQFVNQAGDESIQNQNERSKSDHPSFGGAPFVKIEKIY
jgi:hypothetical protein